MRKVFLFLALFLAACQTTGGSTVGSGPITLSPSIQAHFDEYMSINGSMYAVAIDGRSGASYYYCPDIRCQLTIGERQKAIQNCEERSDGVQCKIYAFRKEIVWDFDGPPLDSSSARVFVFEAVPVVWAGQNGDVRVWLNRETNTIRFQLADGTNCSGNEHILGLQSGSWSVKCENGVTASGTTETRYRGKGVTGTGEDNSGNAIEFDTQVTS